MVQITYIQGETSFFNKKHKTLKYYEKRVLHIYGLSYVLLEYFGILNINAFFLKMPKIIVIFKREMV